MPAPSLRRHELEELLKYCRSDAQEAKIRAVLEHGTHKAAADSLGIGQAALSRSIQVVEKYAARSGFAPRTGGITTKIIEPNTSQGEFCKHLWIPDTQVRYGVPIDHIKALGNYIVEKRFDKIIIAGDWWDMPSISHWNSPKEQERLRVVDDIEAGNRAMSLLWKPLDDYNRRNPDYQYLPERHFLFGNHEERIVTFINKNPALERLLGFHLLNTDRYQLRSHEFLVPVTIDGISYCHYFCQPMTGRPYSGMIETRLKNIGCSFTQGHAQSFAYGERELPNGSVHHGLVSGAFYMHDEGYKGPQGNHHWRGVVVKNEVKDGRYDIMKVSLNYLLRKFL